MTTNKKGHPTAKQATRLARMKAHGDGLRAWLRELAEVPRPVVESTVRGGHGVTRTMRHIKPRPPEYIHRHAHPAGWDRRHKRSESGAVQNRPVPLFAGNTPYVNPARNIQRLLNPKGAKLRPEAVMAAAIHIARVTQREDLS